MTWTTKDKEPIYKIRFKTFCSSLCDGTATTQLNQWIEEHPEIEVISWQTTPVGTHNELYITIQYKEKEE